MGGREEIFISVSVPTETELILDGILNGVSIEYEGDRREERARLAPRLAPITF